MLWKDGENKTREDIMAEAQSGGIIAPNVFTAHDVELMKRKFDRTCEELGLFPEDEAARRSLGQALIRAVERGDIRLDDVEATPPADLPVEHLYFEGEEMAVPASTKPKG
jgi:hypothetical protein